MFVCEYSIKNYMAVDKQQYNGFMTSRDVLCSPKIYQNCSIEDLHLSSKFHWAGSNISKFRNGVTFWRSSLTGQLQVGNSDKGFLASILFEVQKALNSLLHTNLGWASCGKCSKPGCFQNLGFWSPFGIPADFLRGLTVANSLQGTSGLVGTSRCEQASGYVQPSSVLFDLVFCSGVVL